MIIRWLGAFRHRSDLAEAIRWEVEECDRRALAAERLQGGRSYIAHARVGLLAANRAVVRNFRTDVWSEVSDRGYLRRCRREDDPYIISRHREAWVRPGYWLGIVVKGKVSPQAWQACVAAADRYGLPILYLTRDGQLIDAREDIAVKKI